MGALARTLWRVESPRAILSESPRGSGATPVGCAHAHPLASQITPWAILSESPGGSGLVLGTEYWVPKEEELITIKR